MIMNHSRSSVPMNKIPKKRKKSVIPWRKDVDKYRRCQPKGPPLPPTCNHSFSKFECSLLGQREMECFHRKFYYTRNKVQQDAFILRHCHGRSPKRKSSIAQKERKLTVEYFVPARERNVQVCKEAFIGILRVNKSRINALLKSFYKIDASKDNTSEEQSSLNLQVRSEERRRKGMKDESTTVTNSRSLANIEHYAETNFSFEYRYCQSECEAHDKINNLITLTKPTNDENETNSDHEVNLSDWLNLDSKVRRRRVFNWSPLRETPHSPSDTAVDGKVFDPPQKENISAPTRDSSINYNNESNIWKENAEGSTDQTINISRISLNDQSHVYESKRRRLRKLESIDEKENHHQKVIKKKNNIRNSKPEQNKKSILATKKIKKKSFLKRKDNKFGQNIRVPLRTLC